MNIRHLIFQEPNYERLNIGNETMDDYEIDQVDIYTCMPLEDMYMIKKNVNIMFMSYVIKRRRHSFPLHFIKVCSRTMQNIFRGRLCSGTTIID